MPEILHGQAGTAAIAGERAGLQNQLLRQNVQAGQAQAETNRKRRPLELEKIKIANEAGGLKNMQTVLKNDAALLNAVLQLPPGQQEKGFQSIADRLAPETVQMFRGQYDPQKATLIRDTAISSVKAADNLYGKTIEAVDKDGNLVFVDVDKKGIMTQNKGKFKPKQRGPLVNIEGDKKLPFKLEKGMMLKDPNDPSKGMTPIPGGTKDDQNVGDAGKTQMLRTAKNRFEQIKKLMFKGGKPDFVNIANMTAGTPKTEGRRLGALMEVGIQAITRLETGAAMPPQEVENTRKRFQPSVLDDEQTINIKMQMFDEFISGSLRLIDPSDRLSDGRFNMESIFAKIDAELASRTGSQDQVGSQDQQALEWANANPNDPRAAQIMKRLSQ